MRINSFQDAIQSRNQSLLPKIHDIGMQHIHRLFQQKIKRHRCIDVQTDACTLLNPFLKQ